MIPFAERARFEQLVSRSALALEVGATMAETMSQVADELGMDPHQIVAAVACAVEVFAAKHATPAERPRLIRLVADRILRRAPKLEKGQRHAVPVGRTFGELRLLQTMSRLVADMEAVRKLAPEVWHASDEVLAVALRQMAEAGFQRCRGCGCSDHDACPGGCSWIEPDLCSRCAGINHPSAA